MEDENLNIATSRRAKAGVNPEPGTISLGAPLETGQKTSKTADLFISKALRHHTQRYAIDHVSGVAGAKTNPIIDIIVILPIALYS